jgi:hypothetical protein
MNNETLKNDTRTWEKCFEFITIKFILDTEHIIILLLLYYVLR